MEHGFLDKWLICGPFYSDRGWATLDEDYLFGEADVVPRQGMRSFGREWIPWDTEEGYLQFLFAPFEHTLFCTAYAHTYVSSPQQMEVKFLCGSDDGIAVWVNGENVWFNDVNRACVPGDDSVSINLNMGWNRVLVKVRQGMAHWQFAAQIVDLDNKEIPGLIYSREGDVEGPAGVDKALGVRVRFFAETYDLDKDGLTKTVQFEVGNLSHVAMGDVSLCIASGQKVSVGMLEMGMTRVVDVKLPFESVSRLIGNGDILSASIAGEKVAAVVQLSDSSRLLRDLFAPIYASDGIDVVLPEVLQGYRHCEISRDADGRYVLVDPPGLRRYLGGIVGRFPMPDADRISVRQTCNKLLSHALAGEVSEFAVVLGEAKLPLVGTD